MMGVKPNQSLTSVVNPELAEESKLEAAWNTIDETMQVFGGMGYMRLTTSIENIGATVEKLLIKHGKGIIEEQFVLNRLANATIDSYAVAVVLSRASRSLHLNHPSGQHEINFTKIFCSEAGQRIDHLLRTTEKESTEDKALPRLSSIAKDVIKKRGIIHQNPVGF